MQSAEIVSDCTIYVPAQSSRRILYRFYAPPPPPPVIGSPVSATRSCNAFPDVCPIHLSFWLSLL